MEVFVAVLGCSHYTYVEVVPSQKKHDFINANQNALHFVDGVPRAIVPDCLKSAVIKSDRYEPEINTSYYDFSRHYNITIIPARALKPKDKLQLLWDCIPTFHYNNTARICWNVQNLVHHRDNLKELFIYFEKQQFPFKWFAHEIGTTRCKGFVFISFFRICCLGYYV